MRSARAAREASFQTHGQALDLRIPRPHGQPVFGDSCPPSRARADTSAEPSYSRSLAANDDPPDAAICGLIIRRLKKKGPNCRFASHRFPSATPIVVALQQLSRVGRRGLEPRTYGLKEDSGERLASQRDCKQKVFPHREPPRTTQIDKERAKKGPQGAIFEIHRAPIVNQLSHRTSNVQPACWRNPAINVPCWEVIVARVGGDVRPSDFQTLPL
jgi:hypothetical protein